MFVIDVLNSSGAVVAGSTGKEVAIFDIHPNTGTVASYRPSFPMVWDEAHRRRVVFAVSNIVAKQISVVNSDYSPVTVRCDPTAVSLPCLSSEVS
jgi:hypothetical protein